MNKKVIIHGCLLGGLIVYTSLVWSGFRDDQQALEKAVVDDRWGSTDVSGSRAAMAEGMIRVAVPLLASAVYGAGLAIIYGLPALAGRVTEEMMGSTAEVDHDPMSDARSAVEEEDYTEAISIYHEVLTDDPGNRRALVEIARIQRECLESPALAASTLEEGLKDYEWESNDRAFLMFRMAEIYEEDVKSPDRVKAILKEVVEKLEGTRHAANAAHKLHEMESG